MPMLGVKTVWLYSRRAASACGRGRGSGQKKEWSKQRTIGQKEDTGGVCVGGGLATAKRGMVKQRPTGGETPGLLVAGPGACTCDRPDMATRESGRDV